MDNKNGNNRNMAILISVSVLVVVVIFSSSGSKENSVDLENENTQSSPSSKDVEIREADEIEVVHFHNTQQCWSCLTLGEYARQTVEEFFPDEYESGKIKFLDVNIDLAENKKISKKFEAYGSSLFLNVIKDEEDHIIEDVDVWRLIYSEKGFKEYLSNKLESYLN